MKKIYKTVREYFIVFMLCEKIGRKLTKNIEGIEVRYKIILRSENEKKGGRSDFCW